jgi:HAD superfamily hydrolase (TIGR01509 family)
MNSSVPAVLFDLDGVLVDACDLHYQALNKALAEHGYTITPEEHYKTYNGRPTKVKLLYLTEQKGLPVALYDAICQRKQEFTRDMIRELIWPNPDTQRLLRELDRQGIEVGVCSNSIRASVVLFLEAAGLHRYVHTVVGNDEGLRPKPAPDLFLEGSRRLCMPIDECVIVEDSPVGLKAAVAANPLRVVKVEGPHEVNLSLLPQILGE